MKRIEYNKNLGSDEIIVETGKIDGVNYAITMGDYPCAYVGNTLYAKSLNDHRLDSISVHGGFNCLAVPSLPQGVAKNYSRKYLRWSYNTDDDYIPAINEDGKKHTYGEIIDDIARVVAEMKALRNKPSTPCIYNLVENTKYTVFSRYVINKVRGETVTKIYTGRFVKETDCCLIFDTCKLLKRAILKITDATIDNSKLTTYLYNLIAYVNEDLGYNDNELADFLSTEIGMSKDDFDIVMGK